MLPANRKLKRSSYYTMAPPLLPLWINTALMSVNELSQRVEHRDRGAYRQRRELYDNNYACSSGIECGRRAF